jgi:phosphatidate cytidylyltransferase
MAVAGSDGFQYFSGKLFGRTKIVPKISPNKSLEGYVTAVAICNAVYFGYLAKYDVLSPPEAAVFVNGMLLAGIFGDLSISWWKRNHMIKDTSALLLAHGGLLDRCAPWLRGQGAAR